MRRWAITLLFVAMALATLTTVGGAQNTSESCAGTVNNSTIQGLCDRVEALEQTKSNLRAEVTSLRGQVEKLQYDLNHTQSMESLAERMGFVYQNGNPQVLLLRLQRENAERPSEKFGLFQKCAPRAMDNDGYDFDNDGRKEYCRVPIDQVGGSPLAPIEVSLFYSEPGMNETFVISQSNAESRLREIQQKVNDEGGIAAYDRWKTNLLADATQKNFWSSAGVFVMGGGIGGIGMMLVIPAFRKLRERRRVTKSHQTGARSEDNSWRDKLRWFRR